MKYESAILKRLIDTYGVVGNPKYISEIIKEFIVQGKECYPNLFTYQSDWLAHIDEFGLSPSYTVSYTGQSIYAPNTLERPVKSAILKGSIKYRDIDTGEFLETFEEGRNLELVSVRMPVLTTTGKNLFNPEKMIIGDGATYGYYKFKDDTSDNYVLSVSDKDTSVDISGVYLGVSKLGTNASGGIKWLFNNGTITSNAIDSSIKFSENFISIYPNNIQTLNKLIQRFNIQLEYGDVKTPYEPYKSNILSTPEDLELRGIGNVKDELDVATGELTQRIGEGVLNGSENWIKNSPKEQPNHWCFHNDQNLAGSKLLISDKFPQSDNDGDRESIRGGGNYIFVYISKEKVDGNVNSFKQWLSQNPIKYQYTKNEESVKTVDLTILDQNGQNVKQLMSFNGGTHFNTGSLEGSLLPTLEVSVETDLEETLSVCSLEGNTM